jgi:hypothetical protein
LKTRKRRGNRGGKIPEKKAWSPKRKWRTYLQRAKWASLILRSSTRLRTGTVAEKCVLSRGRECQSIKIKRILTCELHFLCSVRPLTKTSTEDCIATDLKKYRKI